MQSLGAAHVVMLLVLVVLALDSRRLHALARSTGRARRDPQTGIPAGANPDQVGLTLRQIQMRIHIDWQDGGLGWDGPEILPADPLAARVSGDRVAEGDAVAGDGDTAGAVSEAVEPFEFGAGWRLPLREDLERPSYPFLGLIGEPPGPSDFPAPTPAGEAPQREARTTVTDALWRNSSAKARHGTSGAAPAFPSPV